MLADIFYNKYEIKEHYFDAIVVGGGGGGLNAAINLAKNGVKSACISKVYPTRSHTTAAQGGISAALSNCGDDKWQWHMYDTVKGSDWLGDQDAIEYMVKQAPKTIIELEKMGIPFSRTQDGKIYQRKFGGMTKHFGKEQATRTCCAEDRTGHAILHTLYQQSLKHGVEFFVEYYVIDLLIENDVVLGVICFDIKDGSIHKIFAKETVLATGGYGRVFKSCTSAHTCTGDGGGMVLRCGMQIEDPEFVQFHPTGLYGVGCLISEAVRGEGGILRNCNGDAFMEKYAPSVKDLASRDVVSRSISNEILEGRGVGENKDHVYLDITHLDEEIIHKKLPGIFDICKTFVDVDPTVDMIPVVPTCHYNMGGIPTNINTEVIQIKNGNEYKIKGLHAVGEAACVSVHGANRLGSNSLLDIVVFGKKAGEIISEKIKNNVYEKFPNDKNIGMNSLKKIDDILNKNIGESVYYYKNKMQNIMQKYCNVFRDENTLLNGLKQYEQLLNESKNIRIHDKGLAWNTELIEFLEFENLKLQGYVTLKAALNRTESRGAHTRNDFDFRDDNNWMKHTFINMKGEISYKDVQLKTLTDECETVKPVKRVY